jgi:hypothetical protein
MGMEWFRDLSIVILALVTSAVLIFTAVLTYRLYRITKSALLLIKATSKIAYDTVSLMQEGLKPLLSILTLIKGISGGFQGISKMFKKESNE